MNYSDFFIQSIRSIKSPQQAEVFFNLSMNTALYNKLFIKIIDHYEGQKITPQANDLYKKITKLKTKDEINNFFLYFFNDQEYDIFKKKWHHGFGYFKFLLFSHKLLVILLSNECNVRCNYCKMSERLKKNNHIKFNNYIKLLDWLDEQETKMFILTGGEPTVHPRFADIIKTAKKRNFQIVLNSNYFFNDKISKLITPDIFYSVTIHYNDQYEKNKKLMDQFKKNIINSIKNGINIDIRFVMHDKKYNNFFNFLDDIGHDHFTVSFIHPNKLSLPNKENQINVQKIKEWKKIFKKFYNDAKKRNFNLRLLKPLPVCMFTEKEHKEYKKSLKLWDTCMDRAELTVTPDLKIMWCNTNIFNPIESIFNFKTIEDGRNYIKKNIESFFWDYPSMPKCKKCKYFLNKECQGGCLAYRHINNLPKSKFLNK